MPLTFRPKNGRNKQQNRSNKTTDVHDRLLFRLFRSVPTIYFPVMWFALEVEATDKFVDELKKLLSLPNIFIYAGAIMVLVGSLIVFTIAILYLLNKQRANSVAGDKVTCD